MDLEWRQNSGDGPGFTFWTSGSSVTIKNTRGYGRFRDNTIPSKTGTWTCWVAVNGTKIQTISPYYSSPLYIDIFDVDEQSTPFQTTFTMPNNLIGQTVTVSFIAKKVDYDGGSAEISSSYTFQVSTLSPTVSWNSGSSVSASVNSSNQIVATLSGGASVGNGYSGTVYYRVWCDNTRKNSDGSTAKTWTFDPTAFDTNLTIKVQAYSSVVGKTPTTGNLTTTIKVDGGNYVDYYNGSDWAQCKVFYYNGTNFVECKPYYRTNNEWVEISS